MPFEVNSMQEWEGEGIEGLLSIVIPAHNEEENIEETVRRLVSTLASEKIYHEIVVVNDASTDGTEKVLCRLKKEIPEVNYINNSAPNGFGWAVRRGLAFFHGEAVAIVMADGSDRPEDVIAFYRKLQEGYDCVFGNRFKQGGACHDYPILKLILNRIVNTLIRMLFFLNYNDVTNAFKMYRRGVIAGIHPILSQHFNLTVELPLKAIVRGYSYTVLPNSWYNRKAGVSKLKIMEMGSRYMFILLYCLLEKLLVAKDYADLDHMKDQQLQVWPK